MDQLNFKNMLLAYHAVHDEVLCESMDELGFFDEQEQLNEVSVAIKRRAADASAAKAAKADQAARQSRRDMSPSAPYMQMMSDRATKQHRRLVKAAYPSGRRKKVAEEYEIYELVLEHLLDEGYVDTVEGALAILENMSDEWLEDIFEERKRNTGGWGDDAIERDPLSSKKPNREFLQWSKEHPYDVNSRFPRIPGRPDRGSRTGSNVEDMISGKIRASRIASSPSPVRRETNADIEASMPKTPAKKRIRLSRRGR